MAIRIFSKSDIIMAIISSIPGIASMVAIIIHMAPIVFSMHESIMVMVSISISASFIIRIVFCIIVMHSCIMGMPSAMFIIGIMAIQEVIMD